MLSAKEAKWCPFIATPTPRSPLASWCPILFPSAFKTLAATRSHMDFSCLLTYAPMHVSPERKGVGFSLVSGKLGYLLCVWFSVQRYLFSFNLRLNPPAPCPLDTNLTGTSALYSTALPELLPAPSTEMPTAHLPLAGH